MLYASLHCCQDALVLTCVEELHGCSRAEALEGIVRKLVRFCYLPLSTPTCEILCNKANSNLFACNLNNPCHVLHKLMPPIRITRYSMRHRSHNRELPMSDYLSMKYS